MNQKQTKIVFALVSVLFLLRCVQGGISCAHSYRQILEGIEIETIQSVLFTGISYALGILCAVLGLIGLRFRKVGVAAVFAAVADFAYSVVWMGVWIAQSEVMVLEYASVRTILYTKLWGLAWIVMFMVFCCIWLRTREE